MPTLDLNLLETLAVAAALFFVRQLIVQRSAARLSREQALVGSTLPVHDAAASHFEAGLAQ